MVDHLTTEGASISKRFWVALARNRTMRQDQGMLQALRYLWAFPTSLPGLIVTALTLVTRGQCRRHAGTLEVWGGFARWLLEHTPVTAQAMTLGHVILGRDPEGLDACRDHELVHVRQTELWGPFFLPAYALASLWAHLKGGHYYRDNWFEIDAYER